MLKKGLLAACKPGCGQSHFWQGLVQVKNIFMNCCRKIVGNGERTCFWEEHWIGDMPLCNKFPRLYNLTYKHFVSIAEVVHSDWGCIRFRRALREETRMMWIELLQLCGDIELNNEQDRCFWKLTKSGVFSVGSLYKFIKDRQVQIAYKDLWKLRIPLKIKVFSWLAVKNRILTRDNLTHRGWSGSTGCEFCGSMETIDHLFFFQCPVAHFC